MQEIGVRINALAEFGRSLKVQLPTLLPEWSALARSRNPWFTEPEVRRAIEAILPWLDREVLMQWASRYPPPARGGKTIGLVLAGNIPLVGFHDYLSVLVSGHKALIRTSTQDDGLLPQIHQRIGRIQPELAHQSDFADKLVGIDAVIATGSDNSSRYFEYYFGRYPHIIRRNRGSVAVITGDEPDAELTNLGTDVFAYFGLGCRNVSKLFVPESYSFDRLLEAWQGFAGVTDHHKYANNYDYQKSILIVNRIPFVDSRFVILREGASVTSPVSVVHYEVYRNLDDLSVKLRRNEGSIQCIASVKGWYAGSVPFGSTQLPSLTDYADGADTMRFLSSL